MLKNYKKYRNTLGGTIKAANLTKKHYKEAIAENISNLLNLWKIINQIVTSKSKKKTIPTELDIVNGVTGDP